jgi:hypothetical protein
METSAIVNLVFIALSLVQLIFFVLPMIVGVARMKRGDYEAAYRQSFIRALLINGLLRKINHYLYPLYFFVGLGIIGGSIYILLRDPAENAHLLDPVSFACLMAINGILVVLYSIYIYRVLDYTRADAIKIG